MTNAEKLTKDTELLARLITGPVLTCFYCSRCKDSKCTDTDDNCRLGIKEWLESEVKENAEIH